MTTLLHFIPRPLVAPAPAPPVDRGPLLTAAQVAAGPFSGTVSATWVRRNLPDILKVRLGHSTLRFYANDVLDWIAQQRGR